MTPRPTDRPPLPQPPPRDYDAIAPVATTPWHPVMRWTFGLLSAAAVVPALWLTVLIAFLIFGGLDPQCTEDANPFVIPWFAAGVTLGAVIWMAVASLLVTAVRGRGIAGWTFRRGAVLACVLGVGIASTVLITADWSQQVPSGGCLQMS